MNIVIVAVVHIRNNSTGEVRVRLSPFDGDFIWKAGNFACDCNRAMFFAEAAKEDDPDQECGRTAYSIRIVAADDGRELYADDDWGTSAKGGGRRPRRISAEAAETLYYRKER